MSHTRYLAMRHMMTSGVVWQRMALTAIHWFRGYKPHIPDKSQSQNIILFICMIVCTMMNVHTMPANDDDEPIDNEPIDDAECLPRAPDDERPAEGYRTAHRG